MRIILYTGKGGVGKTTIAAATALRAAERGYRTIVFSTDAAHSLADSFDLSLAGGKPQPIAPNLWGQEINVFQEIEHYWGTIKSWLAGVITWRGLDQILAEEMAILPGMEEMSSLLYITHYHDRQEYEAIVVDCAPTGETLRLLSFPEVARWWMERLFPLERKAAAVLRPLIRPTFHLPIPGDEVFRAIESLYHDVDRMRTILTNAEESTVRLVMNPERMVIKETQRTFTYLNLYGYATDLIVCNRLLPAAISDRYFDSWKESQSKHYQTIEESFAPLPILKVPLMDREVVGLPALRALADALFGTEDPTRIFFRGQTHHVVREDGHYVLRIPVPFVEKEDLSLIQGGDELVIQAGRYRRSVLLPRTLQGRAVKDARFEGGDLKVRFVKDEKKPAPRGGERHDREHS